jgi:hypothetical protein
MTDANTTMLPSATPEVIRECGSCMLCCKLFPVKYFDKPAGKWCVHAKPGQGCSIHGTRPNVCRAFQCEWTTNPVMDPSWQPDKTKFFIYRSSAKQHMIMVDPGSPQAWKAPQYYASIKQIAAELTYEGGMVMVCVGLRRIIVLPDRDEDLGTDVANRQIFIDRMESPSGTQFRVRVGGIDPNPPQEPV